MIYVDGLTKHKSGYWSHLITDGELSELHAFALSIGLKRAWFQNKNPRHPHYDVRPRVRELAILNGARVISGTEMIIILRRKYHG